MQGIAFPDPLGLSRFITPARDQSIQRRTIVNVYVVADPSDPSECLVLDLADAAWRHTDDLCSRGKRSEEHTSELQSLMRISYAVFCLKKKTNYQTYIHIEKTNI